MHYNARHDISLSANGQQPFQIISTSEKFIRHLTRKVTVSITPQPVERTRIAPIVLFRAKKGFTVAKFPPNIYVKKAHILLYSHC